VESVSADAPCILHALPDQTVFDFLSQRHNNSAILWTNF